MGEARGSNRGGETEALCTNHRACLGLDQKAEASITEKSWGCPGGLSTGEFPNKVQNSWGSTQQGACLHKDGLGAMPGSTDTGGGGGQRMPALSTPSMWRKKKTSWLQSSSRPALAQ